MFISILKQNVSVLRVENGKLKKNRNCVKMLKMYEGAQRNISHFLEILAPSGKTQSTFVSFLSYLHMYICIYMYPLYPVKLRHTESCFHIKLNKLTGSQKCQVCKFWCKRKLGTFPLTVHLDKERWLHSDMLSMVKVIYFLALDKRRSILVVVYKVQ